MTASIATTGELTTLWVLVTFSSCLSYGGSFVLAYALLRVGLHDCADAMLLVLALLGLLSSGFMLFGRAFIPPPGEPSNFWCVAQGNGIQFFGVATILWTAYMSLSMVLSLQPGRQPLTSPPSFRGVLLPLMPICLVSFVLALVVNFIDGGYGDATLWCWVDSSHAGFQLGFYCASTKVQTRDQAGGH